MVPRCSRAFKQPSLKNRVPAIPHSFPPVTIQHEFCCATSKQRWKTLFKTRRLWMSETVSSLVLRLHQCDKVQVSGLCYISWKLSEISHFICLCFRHDTSKGKESWIIKHLSKGQERFLIQHIFQPVTADSERLHAPIKPLCSAVCHSQFRAMSHL